MSSKSFTQLRKEIDTIDRALLRLWARRVRVACALGMRKRMKALPLKDEKREQKVMARAVQLGKVLHLPASKVKAFMNIIIATSRHAQK